MYLLLISHLNKLQILGYTNFSVLWVSVEGTELQLSLMVHLSPVVMGTPLLVFWLTCLVSVEPKLPEFAAELLLSTNVL